MLRAIYVSGLVLALVFGLSGCSSGSVPQPAPELTQEPSRNPAWGLDSNDNPRSLLLDTGEYVLKRTDMAVRGRRLGFLFSRVWRSMNTHTTALGRGWDANVFTRLEFLADGTVRHHEGNGRFDDYAPGAVLAGAGVIVRPGPAGRYRMLRDEIDGTFTLRYRNGLKCFFDALGRITRMRDRIGNECTYAYDPAGNLVTFTDDLGRNYTFAYDPADRLASITDFTGRTVRYAYDAAGSLTDATSPTVTGTPHGNDFPNGKTERYVYDGLARVTGIIYPNEVADGSLTQGQTMAYNAASRVLRTTVGGTNASGVAAGGELTYFYQVAAADPARTTVTDRNGNTTVYEFDLVGHVTSVAEQGAGGPFVTRYEYNQNGERTRIVFPIGNSVEYTYDEGNPDVFQRGNLLSVRRVADARASDQAELRTIYTYDPLYNRVRTVTTPRGNDPAYVPQNGGAQSAARYTTTFTFDYQEGAFPPTEATDFGIDIPAALLGLGDVNGNGANDPAMGNLVRRDRPTVQLNPTSNQAAADGDASQEIVDRYTYNSFGQRISHEDPRGNIGTWDYFGENDPDGDGQDLTPGRDAAAGGYLRQQTRDAIAGPRRRDAADPAQITTTFECDPRGNRVSRTDGGGFEYLRVYNELDQVVETERPRVDPGQATGYRHRYLYDDNDNVVRMDVEAVTTDPDTHQPTAGGTFFMHRFKFDILDNLIERDLDATRDAALPASSQPERLVTTLRYDPNENLVSMTRPEGNRTTIGYDVRDLRVSVTRGDGSPDASTWTYGHDLNGNLASLTDADGDAHTIGHDGFDRRSGSVDRDGNETRYRYDNDSNMVRLDFLGRPTADSKANVLLAGHDALYDELGRRIRIDRDLFVTSAAALAGAGATVTDGDLTPGDSKVSTAYEYDAGSRLAFQVRDDLATYAHVHDGANRRVRTVLPIPGTAVDFSWDDNDNPVRRVETHASPEDIVPPVQLETITVYDALNRPERITDPKGQTTRLEYDSRDNMVSMYDARGAVIPDPLGLFPGDINDRGNATHHLFDGVSRRWATTRELRVGGEGENARDTTGAFNADGLVTTLTEYDGNGRVAARIDDNGNTTSYAYDDVDRPTQRTNADGGIRLWRWDRDHRRIGMTDENNTVHTYGHDRLDRLTAHTVVPDAGRSLAGGDAGVPLLVGTTEQTFAYDGRSRMTRSTDNNDPGDEVDDVVVSMIWDSLDRCVQEGQGGLTVGRSFAADDYAACHYPNGRTVNHAYDLHNQLVEVTDSKLTVSKRYLGSCRTTILETCSRPGFGTVAERRQVLDAKKLVQQIDFLNPNGDSLGMLGLVRNRADDVTAANTRFEVPGTEAALDRIQNTALDSLRRVTVQDNSEPGGPAALAGIVDIGGGDMTFIEYGGAQDRRRLTTQPGNVVRDVTFNDVYERDDFIFNGGGAGNGLRTTDDRFVYQWDAWDRLRTVRMALDPNIIVAEYDYDASPAIVGGRRVRKTVGGTETTFFYDGAQVIEERDGSDMVTRQYICGPGMADDILAMDLDTDADGDPDSLFFHLKDFNNNVTQLIDQDGATAVVYAYDANGQPLFRDGTLAPQLQDPHGNPFLFTGRRFDAETGLYYYRARYYDPTVGEFLSRDPAGFWGGPSSAMTEFDVLLDMRLFGLVGPDFFADVNGGLVPDLIISAGEEGDGPQFSVSAGAINDQAANSNDPVSVSFARDSALPLVTAGRPAQGDLVDDAGTQDGNPFAYAGNNPWNVRSPAGTTAMAGFAEDIRFFIDSSAPDDMEYFLNVWRPAREILAQDANAPSLIELMASTNGNRLTQGFEVVRGTVRGTVAPAALPAPNAIVAAGQPAQLVAPQGSGANAPPKPRARKSNRRRRRNRGRWRPVRVRCTSPGGKKCDILVTRNDGEAIGRGEKKRPEGRIIIVVGSRVTGRRG